MSEGFVDLRSDTVTRPTEPMRMAMARAEVGDDVFGEDPTIRRLEERAAALLGREAALFVPTGTMGNQIAIHLQSRRGEDVLVESSSHVYLYELGAMAAWSGAMPRVLEGERGRLRPEQISRAIAPDIYYLARAAMLVLENTHNHAGGTVTEPELLGVLAREARSRGLRIHLDGARIFNAATAVCRPVAELAAGVDTVMFSLSKALGAPVGSMLAGEAPLIREARVVRKRMGGGMRQAGVLAAAGLYALDHHVARLAEDHRRAARLAAALAEQPAFELRPDEVRTNIVIASVREPWTVEAVLDGLRERGVLAVPMGRGRVRFVTHLDVDDAGIDRASAAAAAVGARP